MKSVRFKFGERVSYEDGHITRDGVVVGGRSDGTLQVHIPELRATAWIPSSDLVRLDGINSIKLSFSLSAHDDREDSPKDGPFPTLREFLN